VEEVPGAPGVKRSELYEEYVSWRREQGLDEPCTGGEKNATSQELANALRRRFDVKEVKKTNVRWWAGIQLTRAGVGQGQGQK
jgi:hypothetical protein